MLKPIDCNPFLRAAMVQNCVMEGSEPRRPFDNRIFFVYGGQADVFINGDVARLKRDSFVFLTPFDEYFFKGKISAAVLNFDMTTACRERKDPICPVPRRDYDETRAFDETIVEGFSSPVVFDAEESLRWQAEELVDAFVRGGDFSEAACSALLKKLLVDALLYKNQAGEKTQNSSAPLNENKMTERALLAEKVLRYVKTNATKIEKNSDLTDVFGYHHVYLADVFKKRFGKTLHSVILEEKLYVASRLLTYTNDSVEEVAFKSGMSGRSYFCTAFKKRFSVSPIAYRNRHRVDVT